MAKIWSLIRKFLLRFICNEYLLFHIYETNIHMPNGGLVKPNELLLKKIYNLAQFSGIEHLGLSKNGLPDPVDQQTFCFGAWVQGKPACLCWALGDRAYYKKRKFWPIGHDEAKLINLATVRNHRGKGIAPLLIDYVKTEMHSLGYNSIYARIWHSNRASIRAFEKAGWKKKAIVATISLFNNRIPIRIEYLADKKI